MDFLEDLFDRDRKKSRHGEQGGYSEHDRDHSGHDDDHDHNGHREATYDKCCAQCGTPNPSHANFCMGCGAKMAQALQCPKCTRSLEVRSLFCPNCGAKI